MGSPATPVTFPSNLPPVPCAQCRAGCTPIVTARSPRAATSLVLLIPNFFSARKEKSNTERAEQNPRRPQRALSKLGGIRVTNPELLLGPQGFFLLATCPFPLATPRNWIAANGRARCKSRRKQGHSFVMAQSIYSGKFEGEGHR